MRPQWRLTRSRRPKGVAATVVKDRGFLLAPSRLTRSLAIRHQQEADILDLWEGREATEKVKI
jgi:hypothetical protein